MDPLTHILLTRKLVSKRPRVLAAGTLPDAPFYLAYPSWVIARGKGKQALVTDEWPDPPQWMLALHHAFHSLPVALAGALVIKTITSEWPRQELAAWVLHIAVDVPTHSRDPWGPRFLWPFSEVAMDGVSWPKLMSQVAHSIVRRRCPGSPSGV